MERNYQDSDFKEDKDIGYGICKECGNEFYPAEEIVSHGCLGEERTIALRCSCDDERERSWGPAPDTNKEVAVTYDEDDMPF